MRQPQGPVDRLAGMMTRSSSSPMRPDSPAWGLRPHTPMGPCRPSARRKSAVSRRQCRMRSPVTSPGTSRSRGWVVTRETRSMGPLLSGSRPSGSWPHRCMHTLSAPTPSFSASNSVWPGKSNPAAWSMALFSGQVSSPSTNPVFRAAMAASRLAPAAKPPAGVGWPGVNSIPANSLGSKRETPPPCSPNASSESMTWKNRAAPVRASSRSRADAGPMSSTLSATGPDSRKWRTTSSGPRPQGSPRVMHRDRMESYPWNGAGRRWAAWGEGTPRPCPSQSALPLSQASRAAKSASILAWSKTISGSRVRGKTSTLAASSPAMSPDGFSATPV